MAALTKILTQRRQAAIARAEHVADGFSDHRSAGMEQQIELEQALDDADRYERMLTSVGGAVVRREAGPYYPGGPHSFFSDLAHRTRFGSSQGAEERLQRLAAMSADVERVERRDVVSSGLGGTIPPKYLLDEAATAARAASPLFDVLRKVPLDHEGMSVEIGRITTGAVAAFSTEGSAPDAVDLVSAAMSLPVKFVSAKVTTSWTFYERARSTSDLVVARDLGEAVGYAAEYGIINGAGGTASPVGIFATPNLSSVAYTDASATVAELIGKVAAVATTATAARKLRPNLVVMHSRRWFWLCSQADTALAPIVGLSTVPPDPDAPYVGSIAGLPIVISDAVPTTVGGDQDVIILIRRQDMLLAVDDRHMQVEALIQMPSVDLWAGEYLVFTAGRYPSGIGVVTGTGLNAVAT